MMNPRPEPPSDPRPTGETCRWCGSSAIDEMPAPPNSPHHARLVCLDCNRMQRWLPKPVARTDGPSAEILALVHDRKEPCVLRGTEKQCRLARSYRANALFNFKRRGRDDIVALLKCIVTPGWFIANHGKPFAEIRWPRPDQLEPNADLGRCVICDGPSWGAETCCDACLDKLALRRLA
jgi:hypothetical protein